MEPLVRLHRLVERCTEEGLVAGAEAEISKLRRQLEEEPWVVALLGDYNAGKTTLLNALAGADLYRSGPTPTTDAAQRHDLAPGLTIVDLPGLAAPDGSGEALVAEEAGRASCAILCLNAASVDAKAGLAPLDHLGEGTPLFAVVNVRSEGETREAPVLEAALRERIVTGATSARLAGVFAVNADAGLRGAVEGKLRLREESRIEALSRELLRAHERFRGGRARALATRAAEALRPATSKNAVALALFAELRIVRRLLGGARSISVAPELRARCSGGGWRDLLGDPDVAEIRRAGPELYCDMPDDPLPLIEGIDWSLDEDRGSAALAGVELRGGRVQRRVGDLFLVRSQIAGTRIESFDRGTVWGASTSFDDAGVPGTLAAGDGSSTVLAGCTFASQGSARSASPSTRQQPPLQLRWTGRPLLGPGAADSIEQTSRRYDAVPVDSFRRKKGVRPALWSGRHIVVEKPQYGDTRVALLAHSPRNPGKEKLSCECSGHPEIDEHFAVTVGPRRVDFAVYGLEDGEFYVVPFRLVEGRPRNAWAGRAPCDFLRLEKRPDGIALSACGVLLWTLRKGAVTAYRVVEDDGERRYKPLPIAKLPAKGAAAAAGRAVDLQATPLDRVFVLGRDADGERTHVARGDTSGSWRRIIDVERSDPRRVMVTEDEIHVAVVFGSPPGLVVWRRVGGSGTYTEVVSVDAPVCSIRFHRSDLLGVGLDVETDTWWMLDLSRYTLSQAVLDRRFPSLAALSGPADLHVVIESPLEYHIYDVTPPDERPDH